MTARGDTGFTLVELLVALLIFALLSAAAAALLSFGVDARARTAERLDAMARVVRLRALLTADLAQAAPRPWRDTGGAQQPAFATGGNGTLLIGLVRRGWRNDGGVARSSLQRVEYRLDGDRLQRIAAPMVDGAPPLPPATVMTGVTALRLRVFSAGAWRDQWQPVTIDALPDAVELTATARAEPPLRQLFLVGPGPVAAP